MPDPKEIKKKLREVIGIDPNLPITGIIENVTGDSCSVKLKNDFVVSDVKIKATVTDGNNFTKLIPKKGSTVTMISLDGTVANLSIIKVDEVEKIHYKQDGLEVLIDSTDGKIRIKNNGVSFIDLWKDLKQLIAQLKVSTPMGPSGVPLPDTQLALTSLETKFNQLIK